MTSQHPSTLTIVDPARITFAAPAGGDPVYAYAYLDGQAVGYLHLEGTDLNLHMTGGSQPPRLITWMGPDGQADDSIRGRALDAAARTVALSLSSGFAVSLSRPDWEMRDYPPGEITVAALIDSAKGCCPGDYEDIPLTVTNGHTGERMRLAGVREIDGHVDLVVDPESAT